MSRLDTPPANTSPATTGDIASCEGFLLVISEFGRIIYVSQSVLQQVGFAPSDLTGHSWFSLLHPDDQIEARAHLKHAVSKCTTLCEGSGRRLAKSSSLNDMRKEEQEKADGAEEEMSRILKARLVQGSRGPSWQAPSCPTNPPPHDAHAISSSLHSTSDASFSYRPFTFTGAARKIKHSPSHNHLSDPSSLPTRLDIVWVGLGMASKSSSRHNVSQQSLASASQPAYCDASSLSAGSRTNNQSPATSPLTHFVIRHDLNGRMTWVDDRCRLFTGYGAEELIGTSIFDHVSREDIPYLQLQYDHLKTQQSESIAAVYRFKHATAPASDGLSEDVKYVYLNCRAYLALNPNTFLLDQIACLAAAETEEEGRADVSRQMEALKKGSPASKQCHEKTQLTMTSCSLEHLIDNEAQVIGKSSPIQSPDSSNIHPVSPQSDAISDTSSSSPANAVAFHQAQNVSAEAGANGGVHHSQVAVIDSQSSPPKSTSSDSSDSAKQKRQRSKSGQQQTHNQVPTTGANAHLERSHTEPHIFKEAKENHPQNVGSNMHDNRAEFHDHTHSALQNSSPNLYSMLVPDPNRPPNPSYQEGNQRGRGFDLQQGHPQNMANNMFHQQLKDKHRYLEESIKNQGNHLQMLQQKLMQLAEQAVGIYPVELQLQRPLHRVMELQGRLNRHRDQTLQQRAQVDIATRVVPNRSQKLSSGGESTQRSHRRQTPSNPPRPNSVSVPCQLNRKSSLPVTNSDTAANLPANNVDRQASEAQSTDGLRSASSASLPLDGSAVFNSDENDQNNTAQYSRVENALSPPFVDMTSTPKDSQLDNRFLPDLGNSTFDDDLLNMPYMGADFEDKLSELEMLFSPDFGNFPSDVLTFQPQPQAPQGSPSLKRAPSAHSEPLNAAS
ncbi:hypothetical protein RvY_17505 [Ramazzottius varieornatus]|uniref:PAS domain-containing protein n=1 Tax=Ramazzottius varieornatus TaxID=947166 RepID=A0A1D1W2B9_RAMVA|nr:hypothetical protein RvY_17505 [Ramazzottius varieornatus]